MIKSCTFKQIERKQIALKQRKEGQRNKLLDIMTFEEQQKRKIFGWKLKQKQYKDDNYRKVPDAKCQQQIFATRRKIRYPLKSKTRCSKFRMGSHGIEIKSKNGKSRFL